MKKIIEKIKKIARKEDLPYQKKLEEFEKTGEILTRSDIYGSGPPVEVASSEVISMIARYSSNEVLDVGCGIGSNMKELIKKGFKCEGIEFDKGYVKRAKESGLIVQFMDAQNLKFPDKSFDTVIMVEVLEHLLDPELAIKEAFRVAKKNVIISVPNIGVLPLMSKYNTVPWHLLEATHLNFFTKKILEKQLKKIARKIEVVEYGDFASWVKEGELKMQLLGVGYK